MSSAPPTATRPAVAGRAEHAGPAAQRRTPHSLRFRLLAATWLAVAVALLLAGVVLSSLFHEHVQRQFSQALTTQLDQLTARLEVNDAGQPEIDPAALTDPRWSRPYSGLYWQVDAAGDAAVRGVLRSRSLWDAVLQLPADDPADGVVHVHEAPGPEGTPLWVVERTVRLSDPPSRPWRLIVAADARETQAAIAHFNGVLAASLAVLGVLLSAVAWAQVGIGLAPLRALQRDLQAVHAGTARRLPTAVAREVQPLVDGFNAVLDRNAEVVARARTQAGNLAHAIKTPLAALSQAAALAQTQPEAAAELPVLVGEQVGVARRHVDWHLARARAAAAHDVPGARVAVQPVVDGLIRVMQRVHAERGLHLRCDPVAPGLAFAGEVQDLQEMVGNLLDNACKWARADVRLGAMADRSSASAGLRIVIDDDGPGIDPAERDAALARGARLDESVPGSGLGLAIVAELAGLYGGRARLDRSPAGGLRAVLELPGG